MEALRLHGGKGIVIVGDTSIDNSLRMNNVYDNATSPQIDLGDDGPDTNDPLDTDSGPNNRQNYPDISYASVSGSSLRIGGQMTGLRTRHTRSISID